MFETRQRVEQSSNGIIDLDRIKSISEIPTGFNGKFIELSNGKVVIGPIELAHRDLLN